jgi:mannose-6-phosphate isomerase-like protein (cupin superfamily)
MPLTTDHAPKILSTARVFLKRDASFQIDIVNATNEGKREDVMPLTRREMCSIIPAALVPLLFAPSDSGGQEGVMPSGMYPFEKLPATNSNGVQIRHVLKGKLATGEALEVHETTLPPRGAPHPPHHHEHSEMWLIREGTVEITVNGASHQLGPGSVGFVHSNDEHGIKNIGAIPATYFVVAIGPGADN